MDMPLFLLLKFKYFPFRIFWSFHPIPVSSSIFQQGDCFPRTLTKDISCSYLDDQFINIPMSFTESCFYVLIFFPEAKNINQVIMSQFKSMSNDFLIFISHLIALVSVFGNSSTEVLLSDILGSFFIFLKPCLIKRAAT